MDSDEYGLGQDLLDELEDLQPKWENLKSFEVINTNALTENLYYDDLSAHVNDMSKLFKFCQNTLQNLVCVGISLPECQDLRLIDFKALLINSCSGSQEFVKSLAETDNFSHLEEIAIIRCGDSDEEDVDITAFLSSDLSKLKKLDIDQAAVSFEEPLHLKCANLKSIRLTMNDSAAGLEDFLIFCSTTLEVLDLKCGGTDTEDDELDFSKLATQSWKIKDLRLELTNEFRGLNHYKDLEKFLNRCSLLEKLSLEAAGSNTFNAIDSDDMDDYHEDLDDSYNEMKGYSRDMEDNSEEDSGDTEDDIDDDSDNDGEEDESYEEDTKQTKVNAKSNRKLENLPLKYLHCPTYFLKQISASCCEHISELKIEDSTGGWVGDLKFPGLNVLTVDRKDKHLVDILFGNAQVRESHNPLFGYKYERSFINATERSSCQSKKRARKNENSCSLSKKRARETPRKLLTPKART